MRVVSVINYKGGVGKTTLTANLGAELACRGKRVLLIDLDPQASLTFSFLLPDDWDARFGSDRTIRNWFDPELTGRPLGFGDLIVWPERVNGAAPVREARGTIGLICSHLLLIDTDLELGSRLRGDTPQQSARNFLAVHARLEEGLASLSPDSFDLVLIDCPPSLNLITRTAIVASDFLLVPARPDRLSTLGITYLLKQAESLTAGYNRRLAETGLREPPIAPRPLGVVFMMVEEHAKRPVIVQANAMQAVRMEGWPVFDAYVKHSATVFHQDADAGLPVVLGAFSQASWRAVVESLEEVATEFLQRAGFAA